MTGFAFLCALLLAGAIHARARRPGSTGHAPELLLVYVLAGYCGILQIIMASVMLLTPDHLAAHLGFPPGNPVQIFAAFLLLGAGVMSVLGIWLRGAYLLAPVVTWSIFFFGATYAHLYTDQFNGLAMTASRSLWIFATHGLVSCVLIVLVIMRRVSGSRGRLAVPA